jgi:predicted nucleic acid-binding protein
MKFVVDTSAFITFLEKEDGYEKVKSLLVDAIDNNVELFASVVTLIEVYYIAVQELGEQAARERMSYIRELKIEFCAIDTESVFRIGMLKANYKMSFADCCIAGLAIEKNAVLLHKDPEFEQVISSVKQLPLPYKYKVQ